MRSRFVILSLFLILCFHNKLSAQVLDTEYPYTGDISRYVALLCFQLPEGTFLGDESSIFKGGDSQNTWMGCKPDVILYVEGETETGGLYKGGDATVVILSCVEPTSLSDSETTPYTGGACHEIAVACGDPVVLESDGDTRIGLYKGGPSNDYFVDCLEKPSLIDVDLPMYQGGRSYEEILSCETYQIGKGTLFVGGESWAGAEAWYMAISCGTLTMTGGGPFFGDSSVFMLTNTACFTIEASLTGENFYGGGYSKGIAVDCQDNVSLGEPTGGYYRGGESADDGVDCYLPPCLDLQPAVITSLGAVPVCVGKTITLTASPAVSRKWQRYNTSTSEWGDLATDPQIIIGSEMAGEYRLVSFSSSAGCADTSEVFYAEFVTNIPQPVITIDGSNVVCIGGSVALHSSPAHEYLWSNGATTPAIWVNYTDIDDPEDDKNYTVTITDINGCQATSEAVTLINSTAASAPVATITPAGKTELCFGKSQTLTANAASTYRWSNGATSQAISVSESGKYTVRITDTDGCQATADSVEIMVHDVRPVVSHPNGLTVCYGAPVTLSLAPHTGNIQWYKDGVILAGETGTTAQVTETGVYHAVLDTLGCQFTTPEVAVNSNNTITPLAKITPSHPVLCARGNVTLTAEEASKYTWSTGDDNQSIWVDTPGTYTLTVEDVFGCQSTTSFELNEVAVTIQPEIQAVSGQLALCPGTSVTLRVSEGASFEWSTGEITREIIVGYGDAMTYSVIAYDTNGCAVTAEAVEVSAVEEIIPVVDTGSGVICGNEPLTITVSPVDDTYTYEWSNGTTDVATDIATPGSYSVTIVTAEGCRFTSAPAVAIQVPAPVKPVISANFTITDDTIRVCPNQVDQIIMTSTAAQVYSWNTGEEARSITTTGEGKYAVAVEYANSCMAVSDTVVVALTDNFVFIETADDETQLCPGGSIDMTVTGAEDGSTFEWYRDGILLPEILSSYTATSIGTYTAKVTGPGGCIETTDPIEITNYPTSRPVISSSSGLDICPYDLAYLTVTPGKSYLWNTGDDGEAIYVSAAGKYVVAVTDEFGCVQKDSVVVTVKPQHEPVIKITHDILCQGDTLILSAPAPAGSSFAWNTGETTPAITFDTPSRFGNQAYWVEVTYPEGCTFRTPVKDIYVNKAPRQPDITVVGSNNICPDLTVALIATKSDLYTYQWRWETSPSVWENYREAQGEGKTFGIVVDENGNYDVTVTDQNGCSSSEVLNLTSLSSASAEIHPKGPINICEKGGWVELKAYDPQQRNVSYKWNTGDTTRSIIVTQEGYYRVTVTEIESGNMCEVSSPRVEVRNGSSLPPPIVTVSSATTFCEGGKVTLISSIAPNGRYEWHRWTDTDTTVVGYWQQLEVYQSGQYMMVFTDNKDCKVYSKIIRVTVNPLPEAVISPAGNFTVCGNDYITLSANEGQGYTYKWSAPSNASTRVLDASVGTHVVTITTPQGCSKTSEPVVIREATTQALAPEVDDAGICEGEKATLTATSVIPNSEIKWWDAATGGNLLGTGEIFETPALNADYEVWVNVSSESMCESMRHKVTVTVGQKVPVNITTPGNLSVCNYSSPVTLAATPTGGVFSGNGVNGENFDPTLTYPGPHWIYYTVKNHGCPSIDSVQISVLSVPQIRFNNVPDIICSNESPIIIDVYPEGGTLSGNGLSGSIFDPMAAGTGDHWLVYSVADANCSGKDSVMITVLSVPQAVINSRTTVGIDGGSFELSATPAGGAFAETTGVTINNGKAFFDPAIAGAGEHEVIYTVAGNNGCEGSTIFIITVVSTELPDVATPAIPGAVCENSLLTLTPPTYELYGATIIRREWLLNGMVFDPATDRVTYADNGKLLRYKVVSNAGEGISEGVAITVNATPVVGDINNKLPIAICASTTLNVSVPTATDRGAAVSNAYWMFNESQVDLSSKVFTTADHGHLLKYVVESTCGTVESNAITVNVNALPAPVISGATTVCENVDITYGITGLTGNYTYDWSITGNGTIQGSNTNATITIRWTSGGLHGLNVTVTDIATGCIAGTSIHNITVNPVPTFTVTDPASVCVGKTIDLTASVPVDASVTYAYYELDRTTVVTTPTALVVPATSVTYFAQSTDKTTGCQSVMQAINVTGNPVPVVTFSQQSQNVCDGDNTVEVTFNSTFNSTTYIWTNNNTSIGLEASGNTGSIPSFTATNTGSSPVTTTITVTPTVGNCTGIPQNFTIAVNPIPTFTVTDPATVCEGTNVDFTSTVPVDAVVDYIFYESDQSTVVSTPTAIAAAAGSTTFYVQSVRKTTGCRSAMQAITVTANPMPTVTVTHPDAVCIGTEVNLENTVPVDATVTYVFFESDQTTIIPSKVIAPAGINSYYVQSRDANMCRSALTPITVSVSAMPTVSIESMQDFGTVCHNGTITLTAVTTGDIEWYGWYDSKGNAENALQFSPNTHEATVVYNPNQSEAGTEIKLSVRVRDRVCGYATDEVRMNILPLTTSASFALITQPVAYQEMCTDTIYEVKVKATDIGDLANVKVKLHDINATQIVIKEASVKQPYTSGTWEPLTVSESDLTGTTWTLPGSLPGGDSALVRVTVAPECDFFSGSSVNFNLVATTVCGDNLPTQILTTDNFHIEQDAGPINTFEITSTFSPDKVTNLTSDIVTWRLKAVVHGNYQTDSDKETMVVLIPVGLTVIEDSYVPIQNALARTELKTPTVDEFGVELGIPIKSGLTEGDEIIAELKFHVTGASCGIYDFYGEIYHTGTVNCNGTECEFNSTRGGVYPTMEVERYRYSGADTLIGRTIDGLWYGENHIVTETPFYDGDEILVDFYIDKDNDGKLTTGVDQWVYTHTFVTSAANIGDILVDKYEKIPFEKEKQLLAVYRGSTVCESPYVVPVATIAGTDVVCRLDTAYYYTAPGMENYSWDVIKPDGVTGATPVRIPLQGSSATNYTNENVARVVWTKPGDYTVWTSYDMPGNPVREMQPTYFPVHVNERPEVALTGAQDTTICEGAQVELSRVFKEVTGISTLSYYREETDGSLTFLSNQSPFYVAPSETTNYKAIAATNDDGCESANEVDFSVIVSKVVQLASITIFEQSNCGTNTGSIQLIVSGGSGSYEYNFDNGMSYADLPAFGIIDNLPVGDYRVYVKDKTFNACGVSISDLVSLPPFDSNLRATAQTTGSATCSSNDGAIRITVTGGAEPYQYSVNGGGYSALPSGGLIGTNFAAGTYSITIKDAANCTTTAGDVQIEATARPNITLAEVSPADCNKEGKVSITLSGGTPDYSYRLSGQGWTTMSSTSGTVNIGAGLHRIYAKDANGCETSDTIRIANTAGLSVRLTGTTDASCGDIGGGSARVKVNGAAPLTYSIDGGITQEAITAGEATIPNLTVGTYHIRFFDGNGCTYDLEGIKIGESPAVNTGPIYRIPNE